MPRPATDKTIQVPAELHAHIVKQAAKEAEKLHLPKLSIAAYLQRVTK